VRAPWISLALTAALSAGLAAIVSRGAAPSVWAATFVGGLLPLAVYLSFGDPFWQARLKKVRAGVAAVVVPALTLAFAVVCQALVGAEFEAWRWAGLSVAVCGAGALLWWARESEKPSVADAIAVLLVWLPIEFALLPAVSVPPGGRPSLNVARLVMVPFLVAELLLVRRWKGLGFDLALKRRMLAPIAVAFVAFAAIAIPVALGTGFATVSASLPPPLEIPARALAIFTLVALPEELLFRGVIQNGFERTLASPGSLRLASVIAALAASRIALVLASLVFGASHLDNPPNVLHYAALATLAGLAYGWVYLRTRNVVASAVVHTAVDWLWSVFFGGAH